MENNVITWRSIRESKSMNEFYEKLWEINLKLEELMHAFHNTAVGGEDVDREFADPLRELEEAYGKVVELVRKKRGLPELPPNVLAVTNEDVKWILGIAGAQEPEEFRLIRATKKLFVEKPDLLRNLKRTSPEDISPEMMKRLLTEHGISW